MTTKYGLLLNHGGSVDLNDDFQNQVSVNAYYRAEKRNFQPGHEMEDWLEAELEIIGQYRNLNRTKRDRIAASPSLTCVYRLAL